MYGIILIRGLSAFSLKTAKSGLVRKDKYSKVFEREKTRFSIKQFEKRSFFIWSEWRDSNARLLAPKASALPLGYTRIL